MTNKQLETWQSPRDQKKKLQSDMVKARQLLLDAEAELAEEQAAVNAFRMHCRLKLDTWVNRLLALQTEKQSLLTRLQLLRQAQGYGIPIDVDDPFWQGNGTYEKGDEDETQELILPTDTPRDKAAEKRLFRELARRFHPDLGSTAVEIAYRTEMMAAVNIAYASRDTQALYDLAGELEPAQAAEIARIESSEIRQLTKHIVRLRQRRRKAKQRLVALRQENTARLWQKARRLEEDDTHWWEVVRREIERAIQRTERDVCQLQMQVDKLEADREPPPKKQE